MNEELLIKCALCKELKNKNDAQYFDDIQKFICYYCLAKKDFLHEMHTDLFLERLANENE